MAIDEAITELDSNTAPAPTDMLVMVTDPTGAAVTENVLYEHIYKGLLSTVTEKTVAAGVLTVDKNIHKMQPQTGTADDIDTITGMATNSFMILFASDAGTDTFTIKHATGNIRCPGASDITFSHGFLFLYYDGTTVKASGGGGGSAGAALAVSAISPTTSNVTAAVNTRYNADISGLTANRNFVLPTATAGDVIELNIKTGDDLYELIVIGDTGISINGGSTATASLRLGALGQTIQLLATTTTNWQIVVYPVICDDGEMVNGKIVPTVVSNDLVLSLKTKAGNNPSPNDPVWVGINGRTRAIFAALSVTKADGTNWAGLGSAELGTLEQDLFPYLIWNTNLSPDAVDIFWSRKSYGNVYSDFSGTSTNETYAAINSTAPAATDDCVNVGRFAATLSLSGTSHVWTVPTYTNDNLKHVPTFDTRVLNFTVVWTNLSVGNGTMLSFYQRKGEKVIGSVGLVWGSTTSISGSVSHTLPVLRSASYGATINYPNYVCRLFDASAAPAFQGIANVSTATVITLAAQLASGTYLQQALLSSTVPFTWTTSDQIGYDFDYFAD